MAKTYSGKRTLSASQEFDMMKLVLDKFLWLGTLVLGYGLWLMLTGGFAALADSLLVMAAGAIIFILFITLLIRDYEWAKRA